MTTRQRWTMLAAILGSSIVFLDGTIVNVALPRIGQELPASLLGVLEGQTYVNSGFLAVLAALLILGGAISDRYGRKRVFSIGLIGFGATSLLCGIAPSLEALVLFRLVQGAAAALLVPGSLALITATFEGAALSRAFGIWAAATSAATLFAPVLGGLLVQYASWRIAFLLNLPLAVVGLVGLARGEAESVREGQAGRFDWLGSIDVILAVGGLSFGLIRGQQKAWADPVAWTAIAVGLVAILLFPVLMSRRRDPLVPLDLFRNRRFAVINLSTFLIYGALYVFIGYSAIFVQGTLGYSVVAASVVGLPVGIILTLASAKVGGIAGRLGPRRFLVAGPLIMAAGLLWFARIPSTSAPWLADLTRPPTLIPPASTLIDILPTMILFGIGISLVVAPLTSTLMSSIPVSRAGLGSAINNAISRVGQPLIGALVFIAITATFYNDVAAAIGTPPDDPTLRATVSPLNPPPKSASPALAEAVKVASVEAFRLAVLVSAGLLILGAAANGLGLREALAQRAGEAAGDRPVA
jgi:EmrB/QacA subfamily drug resistance transporter